MKRIFVLAMVLGAMSVSSFAAEQGWKQLFNGKDLKGWVQKGGEAKYEVKDGAIVGSTVLGTPNSFLCTEKDYGDFILEMEFRVNPVLNSGVQIRSQCFDEQKTIEVEGKKITTPPGRVHGYQVEIDMDQAKNRWWVAGIYDEGRRGWLYPGSHGGDAKTFTAEGAKAAKPGDWNKLRVEAKGDSLKTWLNGVPRVDMRDSMTPKGFIALQVHSVGKDRDKEGITVEWRKVRIKEL